MGGSDALCNGLGCVRTPGGTLRHQASIEEGWLGEGAPCSKLRHVSKQLLRDPGRRRRQLPRARRRGHRLSRAERLRQIDHDEDDHRPDRADGGRDLFRRRADPARSDRLQAAARLRARRAAPLSAPDGPRVSGDGRRSCAGCRARPMAERIDGLLDLLGLVRRPPRRRSRPIRRACGRRCCSPRRCCTIPT